MTEASRDEKSTKGKGTETKGKGGGEDKDASILSAEAFTHGGIRKAKFEPKVPARRLKKLSAVKREPGDEDNAELSDELQKLIMQSQQDAAGFRSKPTDNKAPVRVAFGFGSAIAGRAAAASFGDSKSRVRSGGSGGGGGGGGGGGSGGSIGVGLGGSSRHSNFVIKDEPYVDAKPFDNKKIVAEPLDYSKYYPVTLPLRTPMSGIPDLLDEEEFGESQEYDEDAVPAAEELGLVEESEEDKLIFFQLPSALPVDRLPITEGEEGHIGPSTHTGDTISLDMLPEGLLGKLLIYESGAVKLKLGDLILDALPGTNCVFAQELAAIDPVAKHCLFLGDIGQRIVLTPDVDKLLRKSFDIS